MGFGGSSGGSSALSGATDVALNNPLDTHVLSFDSATTKWSNASSASIARIAINAQTASYTLVLADAGKAVEITSTSATNVTIPNNSTVAFPIGTVIEVAQMSTGAVTLVAASGVTLQAADDLLQTRVRYSVASLRKRTTNTWLVVGDLQ